MLVYKAVILVNLLVQRIENLRKNTLIINRSLATIGDIPGFSLAVHVFLAKIAAFKNIGNNSLPFHAMTGRDNNKQMPTPLL